MEKVEMEEMVGTSTQKPFSSIAHHGNVCSFSLSLSVRKKKKKKQSKKGKRNRRKTKDL